MPDKRHVYLIWIPGKGYQRVVSKRPLDGPSARYIAGG